MDASGQLWDRKQHRIDYFGDVRLLSPSREDSVVARAENLSEAGVFVTTARDAEIGAEVLCELPLAHDHVLTLRGRVAWVRPATPQGIGIEFIEVPDDAAEALREAIGPPRQPAVRVKVRFEGMPEPVRAEALTTESGICLRTALPFLRLNSPVEFTFTDGEPAQQQGWLQDVTLEADGRSPVPRLQVKVAQEQPASLAERSRPEAQREAATQPEPEACQPATGEDELPSVLVDEEMIIEDEHEAVPLVRVKSRPTLRNSALTEQLLPACADERFEDGEVSDPCERSHWDFEGLPDFSASERRGPIDEGTPLEDELPGMDPDQEDPQFWQRSSPPRRRLGLWAAALAMLVLAIGSAHVTGFLGVAEQQVSRWIDGARALLGGEQAKPPARVAKAEPEPTKAAPSPVVIAKAEPTKAAIAKAEPSEATKAKAEPSEATKTKAEPSEATKTKAEPSQAGKTAPDEKVAKAEPSRAAPEAKRKTPLQLEVDGALTRLRLPIKGSLRGKQSYPLANPDGLVVRLPHARSAVRHGTYKLRDGALRTLWIKRHERGVRFRVLYRRPRPACKLAITKRAVLVRCREARKLASR